MKNAQSCKRQYAHQAQYHAAVEKKKKKKGERKEERIEKEREGDLAAPDRSSFQCNGFDGRSG